MLDWELKSEDYEVILALSGWKSDSAACMRVRACVRACSCVRTSVWSPTSCQSHARIELDKDAEFAEQLTSGRSMGHT